MVRDPRMDLPDWSPLMVSWLDGSRPDREVVGFCPDCGMTCLPLFLDTVAPDGVAHEHEDGGIAATVCGLDCTGLDWWHRL